MLAKASSSMRMTGLAPRVSPAAVVAPSRRSAVQVVAAEAQNKKRTPQPVKRAQLAEERRMSNKGRKSAIATRIKKVLKLSETLVKAPEGAAEQVPALEKLVAEAYKEIDTAAVKGVIHANTAARRKARVARYKQQVLISAGLYTPAPEQPGFAFYQRVQAAKAKAAGAAN
ncbi:30S ribosomal protein S20 [Monoraphidium neglectum]|uniref:30S ribosomal protein S20 n=1 Tax=Monoraphidium neglectum TaxID=145388 RepID=A0A0D2LJB9_9CHLO|nr:30S ribosomal protein S20 [Monoraphidium neglectum]KIZ06524.1 30S ribosomal protein S20 [Monoraphidium neglectum]|eukprot:XP_013905543.1 30S ribosomal protein S20 [Monoraphidium neglectum]